MIGLLQRVSQASVSVDGVEIAAIGRGLLVFVAVHRDDTKDDIRRLARRILTYRVFPDDDERMNLSVQDVSGSLLLVPQFTLTADTRKGTRASFTKGAIPSVASDFFDELVILCREELESVAVGRFGADMTVNLTNDGPVTFWLNS